MTTVTNLYADPGVRMAAEFHDCYGCAHASQPGMPVLREQDVLVMEGVALYLATYAARLKELCAGANANGGAALGLLLVRIQGLVEETGELAEAFAEQDLAHALRELVDVSYFADGTYLTLGSGHLKLPAYREVHRANMSKLGTDGLPIISEAGRVVKGPNYRAPDVEAVVGEYLQAGGPVRSDTVERWD